MGVKVVDLDLINNDKTLSNKVVKIIGIDRIDDYLFIKLDNNQKILTDGRRIFEFSEYNHLVKLFTMSDRVCAVFVKGFSTQVVVDINTKEVLFEDDNIFLVSKNDDRTLSVQSNDMSINEVIYDVESKKYLPSPKGYTLESSLGNGLYVFVENDKKDVDFYDHSRCIINIEGEILLSDIKGWPYAIGNHLIVKTRKELNIIGLSEDKDIEIKTIKQSEDIIAKPNYYKDNILIIEKGAIKLYTPELVLEKEIKIEDLEEVVDYERVADTLKLCVPYVENGEKINKHIFVNLKTGKYISSLRIECYPYWAPTTYVAKDSIDSEIKNYCFYDENFELKINISGKDCEVLENAKEYLFVVQCADEEAKFINTNTGIIKENPYDFIRFDFLCPYGYGLDFSKQTIDFFDEELNTIISGFDCNKIKRLYEFSFFVVNNFVCISDQFENDCGRTVVRNVIVNPEGEIILDSVGQSCYAVGNFIKISNRNNICFLNTITGEIGDLCLLAKTDEKGIIDFSNITNINDIFSIEATNQLKLLSVKEENEKTKKIGNKK